uniref:Uncharacterized protein n=1 Tax=Caenorhabditis japonica TaxID=281687 RepID=A0A8R1E428_CAEJA
MSGDDGEADFGFDYKQGLKLINPSTQNATNLFNAPLKLPKKIEENESQQAYEPSHQVFKFTESFLEENEEAPGFGENSNRATRTGSGHPFSGRVTDVFGRPVHGGKLTQ